MQVVVVVVVVVVFKELDNVLLPMLASIISGLTSLLSAVTLR